MFAYQIDTIDSVDKWDKSSTPLIYCDTLPFSPSWKDWHIFIFENYLTLILILLLLVSLVRTPHDIKNWFIYFKAKVMLAQVTCSFIALVSHLCMNREFHRKHVKERKIWSNKYQNLWRNWNHVTNSRHVSKHTFPNVTVTWPQSWLRTDF